MITLNEDSIICVNGKFLDIYSYEGELKNKINIDYGEIISFNVLFKYLCIVTNQNYFCVYDITRRNLKQLVSIRKFEKNGESLGEIREAYVNIKANYIAILADTNKDSEIRIPQTKFFIFDVEMDSFCEYEISPNRIPVEIVWDQEDPRLFGVSTEYAKDLVEESNEKYSSDNSGQKTSGIKNGNNSSNSLNTNFTISNFKNSAKDKKEWVGSEFYIFFYTTEFGIHQQEAHPIKGDIQGVFALNIPSIHFIVSKTSDKQTSSILTKKFQFFEGLEKVEDNVKAALIDFSIYMSCGKLDEAYKIVKNIKNPLIWENMAQICIKTKRIDVLEVCLSNMRFSRGMKAVD
jgi:intraflagellar transport protein 140